MEICRRNKYGYCRYGDNCHFRHEKQICTESSCDVFNCEKRHPKICSWFQQYRRCKFTTFCKYKHINSENIDELINLIEENSKKLLEVNKALEAIKKEEELVKSKEEVFEEKVENRFVEFEGRITALFKLLEEKNEKIVNLESSLRETRESLEQVLNEKNLKKKKKSYNLEDSSKFKCKLCNFQSGSQSGLKTHISRKHTNYADNEVSFKCEICDDKYIKEEYLKEHMITHSYYKSEFLKFKCDECDFWGPNAQTMKMHYYRLHCENISCGICNLEVKDVEELDVHTSTCEIFKCKWCEKSYNNFSDIKSHAKEEHNGKSSCYQYNRMRIHEEYFTDKILYLKDLI